MQLAPIEGLAQLVLELDAIAHPAAHGGVEHGHGIATRVLGLVHGDVGVAQHGFGGGARFGRVVGGHAHAGGDGDLDVAHAEPLSQAQARALGQLPGVVGRPQAAGHHHELVAADPGHQVPGAAVGLEPPAHGAEQLVTDAVAQAVVDQPEAVQVEEDQGDAVVGAAAQQMVEVVVGEGPVGQPGEQVVGGLVGQAVLGLGVLAQGPEHPPRRGGGAGDDDHRQDEPIAEARLDPAEGDQGGDRQGDGHEHEARPARRGVADVDRRGHLAQRRMQEGGHEGHVGQAEGQVQEPGIDVGDVRVHQHVEGLAGQGGQQGHEQQAQRHRAVDIGAEGDAGADGHQEHAHRRVGGQQQPDGQIHVALRQRRVDEVHPGQGQTGGGGDDGIEGGVEVVDPGAAPGPGQTEQGDPQDQVAGQGQRVGEQRPAGRQVAQCPQAHPRRAPGQEQQQGQDLQQPGPPGFGSPAPDAGGCGHQAGATQDHQDHVPVRAQQAQGIDKQDARTQGADRHRQSGRVRARLRGNHVGVGHGRTRPTPQRETSLPVALSARIRPKLSEITK